MEELYLWPPYTAVGDPADLWDVQVLIDGEPYPPAGRLRIRGRADRNMAVPFDQRYAVKTIPFGKISLDPLDDTTLKVTPAQRLSMRLNAGTVGIGATDTQIRTILTGRIADTDAELREIYGGVAYQPAGPTRLGDPVTGKVTPLIDKMLPISIDNAKYLSGATGQSIPRIFPYWSWTQNRNVINPTPEYEFSYREPRNVDWAYQDFRFDWTRITDRALQIRWLGAVIDAGGGRFWWNQPPLRRPGHQNLFYGWVVDSAFPNLLPSGGATAMAGLGMFKGPVDLKSIRPQILCYNNLTELRGVANAGTTIVARNFEAQLRGTYITF